MTRKPSDALWGYEGRSGPSVLASPLSHQGCASFPHRLSGTYTVVPVRTAQRAIFVKLELVCFYSFTLQMNPTAYVPTYPQSDLIELHSLCHQCYGRILQFSNLYYGATVRRVSGLDSLDFTVSHSRPHFPPQLAIDLPRAGVRYSRIAVTPHHLSPPVVSIRSTRPY